MTGMHRLQLVTANALQPHTHAVHAVHPYLLVGHSSDVNRLELGSPLMPDVEGSLGIGQERILALQQLLRQEVQEQWVAARLLEWLCHHGCLTVETGANVHANIQQSLVTGSQHDSS